MVLVTFAITNRHLATLFTEQSHDAESCSLNEKSKTRILKDFNGLVRKGEMLLVLGRPGSGCSTLLKTLIADTHGLSIDDASVLKYQGECLSCVITGTKR
jgi:ABC-type multidrug transport system ATPase subunit